MKRVLQGVLAFATSVSALDTLTQDQLLENVPENGLGAVTDPLCTQTLATGRTLTIEYNPVTELVTIAALVPQGSYTGFGWGPTMTNTEMVVFSGDDSTATSSINYYVSQTESMPTEDANLGSCYRNQVITSTAAGYVMSVSRPLECTGFSNYVIQLDTELDLIWAFNPTSSSLVYHQSNRSPFTQYLNSDGTCASAAYPTGNCDTTLSDGSRVFMFYDPDTDMINLNAKVTSGSYLGWGFGDSMTNTEMVIFSADGALSSIGHYYSTTETQPTAMSSFDSCYTNNIIAEDIGFVVFNTTRPLDCGTPDTFVIQLDTNMTIINAWNPSSPELSYHNGNTASHWTIVSDDGSCQGPDPTPPTPVPSGNCDTTLDDESRVFMFYNPNTELINLNAKVPEGSYLGWGWGDSMMHTEMVIFSADGDSSSVGHYYSTTETTPTSMPSFDSCYTSTVTQGDGYVVFNTTRPLDCGIAQTYVVQLDLNMTVINAWNPTESQLSYHNGNTASHWTQLSDDGSCQGPDPTPPTPVPTDTGCDQNLSDGSVLTLFYDSTTQLLNLNAKVTDGSYAGFGWGSSMKDTEMVIFSADGASSVVSNVYSTGETTPGSYPQIDPCYTNTVTTTTDGYVVFNTTRPLDCGISNTYVVQLGQSMQLITAWNPDNPELSFHSNNYRQFSLTVDADGTCVSDGVNHNPQYYTHGIFMWFSWAVIGLAQIFTNRYLRHKWRCTKILHAILGFFAAALIITAGLIAIKTGGWKVTGTGSLHTKLGFATFVMGMALIIGGMTANIFRLKVSAPWNSKKILLIGKVHKWFGRLLVLGSQFVIGTGFYNFYSFDGKDSLGWGLAGASCAFFFIGLISGEAYHQIKLRQDMQEVRFERNMTGDEFENYVQQGCKLVILDDLVLDVEKFIDQHPGGRFVLQHNIGRDVSKFFYGGYSLEDNMGSSPAKGYFHSTFAKRIVADIAIAMYQPGKAPVARTECTIVEDACSNVNSTTRTIVFQAINKQNVTNWKKYYEDNRFIARHFLVRNIAGNHKDSVWRHYTVSNAMQPVFYDSLVKSLKEASDPEYQPFDTRKHLDRDDQNTISMTIKNYRHPKGISPKIHAVPQGDERYEIAGPMGHGLRLKEQGVHIAFAAGTGVLCFVDLVAKIALTNTGDLMRAMGGSSLNQDPMERKTSKALDTDFDHIQFHLYVSFPRRADSVALELFETLEAQCRRANLDNFHLHLRLSQENVNPGRWDEAFIRREIGKYGVQAIQRVWVCGPPVMNETFDRVFSAQGEDQLGLSPSQYEIL